MHDHQYNGKLLPTHWHQVKLEDVCDMVMGQSPSSSTYNKDGQGLPFLQGKAEFTNLHPIASVYCTDPLKIAKKGSVLISVRAPVGDVNIADQDYIIGRGLGALLLKDGFNPFLFFSLLYNKERLKSQGSGTTFDSITKSTLANFSIFLPPLPEQRAIAHILQTVQNAIQARRKELALERERKAALMQHLFTHGTRGEATKQTEIGEMPESWEVVKLCTKAKLLSGGTPSKQRPEWWQGAIPWASPKDLKKPRLWDTQDHISEEALDNGTYLVPAKTLFVVVRGMILAKNIPIAIAEIPMAFNQDMKAIIPSNDMNSDYLLYAFECYKHNMVQAIGTSAHGTRRVGSSTIEDFLLPYPSHIDEQKEIGHILCLCDSKITALEKEIALQEELFRALLEELMSGRLSALPLVETEGGAREALS